MFAIVATVIGEAIPMSRDGTLSGGLANLSDRVRVIDRDGTDLGFMIVAEAQKIAADQNAELVVLEREKGIAVVRIVIVRKAPMR
jgi:F420-0:gamma-glutamyl ligase